MACALTIRMAFTIPRNTSNASIAALQWPLNETFRERLALCRHRENPHWSGALARRVAGLRHHRLRLRKSGEWSVCRSICRDEPGAHLPKLCRTTKSISTILLTAAESSSCRVALASELNVLANQLTRIALSKRRTCDFTLNSLRDALTESGRQLSRVPYLRQPQRAVGYG